MECVLCIALAIHGSWAESRVVEVGRDPAGRCMAVVAVDCYPQRYRQHLAALVLAVMYLAAAMETNAALRASAAAAMEVG